MGKLNEKQLRFIDEYLIDLNAKQAAIRAGYSPKTAEQQGSRLLSHAKVSAEVADRQKKRAERVQVSQDYVLSSIVEVMQRSKQASPVLDRSGDPVMTELPSGEVAPAYTFNAGAVLKGAELLGKHLGMFDGASGDDGEALPVTVTIGRRKAVGNVRVTGTE